MLYKQLAHDLAIRYGVTPGKEFKDTTGYDLLLIRMWNDGHNRTEIAQRVNKSPDRITNRITELRNELGENIVPKRKERMRRLIQKL